MGRHFQELIRACPSNRAGHAKLLMQEGGDANLKLRDAAAQGRQLQEFRSTIRQVTAGQGV